jgi:Mg-chelatase subunit ChlI
MKLALLLNAINPVIGGVLIRGERGTAKSTAVRALAELLPLQSVVEGCHFGCDPAAVDELCADCSARLEGGENPLPVVTRQMRVVELPINASEDRVVGTIDLEAALREGVKRFEPGVLAEANRNVLYVDEVNLLDDHIVDVLLDAAATGVNVVEREGVSVSHPSRFILVGTMNPEEGDLRPQLLDRFGLCVDVATIHDVEQRVEIVQQRARWEVSPAAFSQRYAVADEEIRANVAMAIDFLPKVDLPVPILTSVARLSIALGVEGHRADIVCGRAACAKAAYDGEEAADMRHILQVAEMVYAHRRGLPESETGAVNHLLNRIWSGEQRRQAGVSPMQQADPGKAIDRLPGDEAFEQQAADENCC